MSLKRTLGSIVNGAAVCFNYLRRSRNAHLYCVGTAKSGTHSIASMFGKDIRSQHEADSKALVRLILDVSEGRVGETELRSYIRDRDKRLNLDVDSSQLNFFILDMLLEEFPTARFLLTIRDCYSWLDSFMNDSLRRNTSRDWVALRNLRFRADFFHHPPEEQLLKEKGLYTLDGYLSYWAHHNGKVLSTVPGERLLIVRTDRISQSASEIAEFAGLPDDTIVLEKSHTFKNPKKYGLLRRMDRHYIEAKARQYCTPLMKQFFPEIESMEDVGF